MSEGNYEGTGSRRKITLNKGEERYIFIYPTGKEDELLDALIEAAKNKRTSFDWFDAAVLSFRLAQSLIVEADGLLKQNGLEQKAEEQP